MSAKGAVLASLVLGLAITGSHRDLSSLRNRFSVAGIVSLGGGLLALSVYAYQVGFLVLGAASVDNCAALLGLTGSRATLRPEIRVEQQWQPPRVSCSYGGHTTVLTSPGTTSTWGHVWWISWALVVLGIALLLVGLLVTRGWRKRRPETQSV